MCKVVQQTLHPSVWIVAPTWPLTQTKILDRPLVLTVICPNAPNCPEFLAPSFLRHWCDWASAGSTSLRMIHNGPNTATHPTQRIQATLGRWFLFFTVVTYPFIKHELKQANTSRWYFYLFNLTPFDSLSTHCSFCFMQPCVIWCYFSRESLWAANNACLL